MTRISEAVAGRFLDYPQSLKGLALAHIAEAWILMSQEEYDSVFLRPRKIKSDKEPENDKRNKV